MRKWLALAMPVWTSLALAQPPTNPVVSPRGVINAFTQQPAPSQAAPGGIIHIHGLNLGPPEGVKAAGTPLPTQLGEPPVEVLINGRRAPLFSASPGLIVAQVPLEIPAGLARVVVQRGGVRSRPARIFIVAMRPSVRTANDTGFGEAAGELAKQTLTVAAFGLGPTEPRVGNGEAGPEDPPASPRATIETSIGGLPAQTSAVLSKERVGEFDIQIQVPPGAQPGDVITITASSRNTGTAVANRTTFQKQGGPEVQFLPSPEGAPVFRSLVTSDLRGNFLVASAERDESGCYPSYLFDVANGQASKIEQCLTTGNFSAASPVMAAAEGSALAALVGPPQGDLQTGVSSKVLILNPSRDPITVELEAPASELRSTLDGDFEAVLAGTPPKRVTIGSQTGEVQPPSPAQGVAQPNAPAPAGAGIDLGDGLTHVLVRIAWPQNQSALIVADDPNQPNKVKIAVVNARSELQGTRDFPEGWVLLMAPNRPQTPGTQTQPAGASPAQAGAGARRLSFHMDPEKNVLYVLVRSSDNARHALAAFPFEEAPTRLIDFPQSWFVAACSPTLPLYNLELSRSLAFLGSNVSETEFKDPCPGTGFLLLDLEAQTVSAVALPGQGQYDADPSASGEVNDFVFGTNTDPSRRNNADTLFALDGVTASAFRLDLPATVTSFAGLRPVPMMNALIGQATDRNPGDAGFVFFDLENAETVILPVPEGFSGMNLLEIYTTTRKLVARGTKSGGTGFQYLIYDLVTGDLLMPPNPEGAPFLGGPPPRPAQTPAPGGPQPPGGTPAPTQPQAPTILQRPNTKANTVTGFAYDSAGRQVGVAVLRVP